MNMLTREERGTVCGMPSNNTPFPPSGSPANGFTHDRLRGACKPGMEDSIRDALALCRAGRYGEIDTVRMLQAAESAEAEKRDFDYGCAIELADLSLNLPTGSVEVPGKTGDGLRPEGTRPS
jgi:hypothetical protein